MYNKIESFWQDDYYFPAYDVVIVGSGFTGLVAGIELLLRKPKWKIGIFESQTHGTLASSRNAGFMCFGSPTELISDIDNNGEESVTKLLQQKLIGQNTLLKHLAGNKGIYRKCSGYELFETDSSVEELDLVREQLPVLNKILASGTLITDYFSSVSQYPFNQRFSSVKFKSEGQLHPTAAVAALSKKFLNLGGKLHLGTSVTHWAKQGNGFELECQVKEKILSKELIVANNGFASELVPNFEVQPQRAQVMVTSPLKALRYNGNFHMEKGYVYFRNVGNRLLLGGLRNTDFVTEQTSELGLNSTIQANLDTLLKKLIPNETVEITHRWSGIMGFRAAQVPKLHMHESGIVIAAGMNGMGTLLGPALGKEAALAVL